MQISQKAAKQLVQIFKSSPEKKGLRVYIQGGGCSGFEYNFELVESFNDDDLHTPHHYEDCQFFICVDCLSATLLDGATLDYKADLTGARFIVDNPNVSGQCSCGSSFSVG